MGKVGVDPCRDKPEQGKACKNAERDRHIHPVAAKRPREILGEKPGDKVHALALSAVNTAVSPNDEAVEIVYQLWVAGLGACRRKIGRRAAIKLSKFAHFHPRQSAQVCTIQHREQVFEPLPLVFALVEERIHNIWFITKNTRIIHCHSKFQNLKSNFTCPKKSSNITKKTR